MKRKIFQLILALSIIPFTGNSQIYPEFSKEEILQDGDIIIKKGIFKNNYEKEYPKKIKADYFTMAVRENRNIPDSRITTIPVVRLHSLSDNPEEPVFLLDGGPGSSNNWKHYAPLWLLDNHDIVIVGYRGVDGSVKLGSDALEEAFLADSNALSFEHYKKIGEVWKNELERYKNEGIDINGYNMIEVIDDIELARNKLGYNKMNLYGVSYGTRVAYLYGLRYPKSINRTFIEGINPPGHFVFDAEITDEILKKCGELWKNDPANLERSADIILTMKKGLASLPVKWKKVHIDTEKVRFMMFLLLYSTDGVGQIFDTFIAAENGDYSGLAMLTMMYDMLPEMGPSWGDSFPKAISADYQPGMDYISTANSKEGLLGAPLSTLFAVVDFSDWEVQMIPEKYRKLDTSYVNTLVLNGNLDVSTPLGNARELIKYLPNGHLVVTSDCGHNDCFSNQPEGFKTLVKEFYLTGEVRDEGFKHIPANLGEPKLSLQKMGKLFYVLKRLGLAKIVAKLMM